VVVLGKIKDDSPASADGGSDDKREYDTSRTTVDMASYGRWVQPRYQFMNLAYRRQSGKELIVPSGVEIVSCFAEGSLQAAYISKTTFDSLTDEDLNDLGKRGLNHDDDKILALEDILRNYDQRQIIHVNPKAGNVSIYQRTQYAEMLLYEIATYFSRMSDTEFQLPAHRQAAFEAELQQQAGVQPFHLGGNRLFITLVQAEIIRQKFFPGVIFSPVDMLHGPTKSPMPHRNRPYSKKLV